MLRRFLLSLLLPFRGRSVASLVLGVCAVAALSGCNYFRQKTQEHYVYVTAREVFLRDRVAAVSNRTGTAMNGEKLVVLDRTRRAIKVRTPRGEVGWVEEKLTADQKTADQFAALAETHAKDPVIAVAAARDEVYLHAAPGRETPRFYRLAEGDVLSLLERATVPKVKPGAVPVRAVRPPTQEEAEVAKAEHTHEDDATDDKVPAVVVPPPVMEDWWLARTAKGQTGWILGRMIDVTVPDTLARYAEGQRIVGAYVLHTVDDPDSGMLENGKTVTAIPEYLTLLAPYKSGLPYDFDQVRVFIWNLKKHRYETGFRDHNILGYLPATMGSMKDPYSPGALAQMSLPSFTYKVLAASAPIPQPDPVTGLVKPAELVTKTYRLEGNICRRILPPGTPVPEEAHPVPPTAKDKNKARKRRR